MFNSQGLTEIDFFAVRIFAAECHVFKADIRLRNDHNFYLVLFLNPNQLFSLTVVEVVADSVVNLDLDRKSTRLNSSHQ